MFRINLILVVLISCLIFLACKETPSNVKKSGSIKGQVINSITQQGMASVNVTTEPPSSSILTANDGTFEIPDLDEGTYLVKALKLNFVCQPVQIKVISEKITNVVLLLTDSSETNLGIIKGKVYNSTTKLSLSDVKITTQPITSTTYSKSDGSFEIFNIPPGNYSIYLSKDSFNLLTESLKVVAGKVTEELFYLVDKKSTNRAPNSPILSQPLDKAIILNKDINLKWSCTDPDGDNLLYDVLLDANNPPTTKIASNISKAELLYTLPKDSAVYYWKVIAKDIYNVMSESNVYMFSYYSKQISNDLILYYSFDDNTANDISGNANNGVLMNSPQFVSGKDGSAVRLIGTPDLKGNGGHVLIPSINFNTLNEFTISIWIYEESLQYSAGEAYINWGNASTGWIGISNFVKPPENKDLVVNFSVGSIAPYNTQTPLWVNYEISHRNKWTHYALVYQYGSVTGYIDGILIGTKSQTLGNIEKVAAIGKHWWNYNGTGSATSMTFQVDEVKIFKRALNSSEVVVLAQ